MFHRLTNFISRFKWFLLVIAFTIPTFTSLLRPGYFPMHDDLQVMRIYQMELCFKDGQLPCRWVLDMGYRYGYPQFEYYGPLPYYLMTTTRLFHLPLFEAMKFGFILALILGNLAMFLLASSLFGVWGGFLSAMVYAYAPFRASDLFSRGAMGESWAFVFLPLILFALLKLLNRPNLKSAAFLALFYAGLLLTHNISTLIFSPMIALIVVFFLLSHPNRKSLIKYGLISLIWSVAIAATFFLPVLLEKGYAHTESLTRGYFNYLAHFVTLKQLFFTSFWGYGSSEIGPTDDLSFFLGPVQVFLFLISLFFVFANLIRKRIDRAGQVVLLSTSFLAFSLFMTHQKSTPLWKILPLDYLQFPWRFLVTANFFLALIVGFLVVQVRQSKQFLLAAVFGSLVFFTNVSYFRPREWFDLTIWEKFSGFSWDRQLTISIFDYLPIFAKFPPASAAPLLPYGRDSQVSILDYNHGSASFRFRTRSLIPDQLTLPQFDFPGWQVKLDGQKVTHRHDNKLGLITLDLPPGDHRIEAVLRDTPIRFAGNLLTLIFTPLALYTLVKSKQDA